MIVFTRQDLCFGTCRQVIVYCLNLALGPRRKNDISGSKFVDSHIKELQERVEERKDEISGCHKQILYLEAYSRRENLKFEGIPELPESSSQQNATSKEDTKEVLVNFMENVLEIEDAKDMEFQRVHRIGKP